MSCEHVARHLDAYVDRELDTEATISVRDHLDQCAVCRRRVAELEALGQLVRSVPYYPASARLRARVATPAARPAPAGRLVTWAAAALVIVSIGAGIGLWLSFRSRPNAVVDELVHNHVRSLMADHLFDVQSTDQHTVKPWFLGKLDYSPPVIDLATIGFPLVGARLDYLDGRPVAAIVYQRQKHTINLFVSPDAVGAFPGGAVHAVRGFHVHHWIRDRMGFWAVSDLNEAELTDFARALQDY